MNRWSTKQVEQHFNHPWLMKISVCSLFRIAAKHVHLLFLWEHILAVKSSIIEECGQHVAFELFFALVHEINSVCCHK